MREHKWADRTISGLPMILPGALLALVLAGAVSAETYRWEDPAGNVHFSDDLASVPTGLRSKVTIGDDITTADPDVRESVAEGRRQAAELQKQDLRKQQERDWARRSQEQQERQANAGSERKNKPTVAQQSASGTRVFKRSGAT